MITIQTYYNNIMGFEIASLRQGNFVETTNLF